MTIQNISPEELRRYMRNHPETTYRLIDVRQPGEYETNHIPGAQLLPLPTLFQSLEALPGDLDLIFYCRSGQRSATAALMAEDKGVTPRPIYNLDGGILEWDGRMVDALPRVAMFRDQSPDGMMATAMNLEKGAQRFYDHVASALGDPDWSALFGRMGKAETAHARTVYQFRRQLDDAVDSFETVFADLDGEVLEGGRALTEVISDLKAPTGATCMDIIEMALDMENRAYDLYRTMADRGQGEAREAFMAIAQAEKGHIQVLVDAIGMCD